MASINKLSIRGIRSFSHEREQVIEFYTPLTMIVGANGCGKTTVIECLKYACTGSLPPGARSGQSFVHDPKVSGTNEVKANIKLRFAGRDGRASVVIRSFQLTQKRVTLQFKALDGVIRTKDDNGVSVSITHRCTELDKHIPLRLGVSKAILENVVFCHQEDASWPLQEGGAVKKKFDDIFESARYTKALETIKKTKQDYAAVVKDLKVDLAGLQERLSAARNLKGELEGARESYEKMRKRIEAVDVRTKELSKKLDELHAVADEVQLLEAQKQSLELSCRDLDVRIGEKRDNIGDALSEDSNEVLERNLLEFDRKVNLIADQIQSHKDEAAKCVDRAQAAKKSRDALQTRRGNMEAQISHQERIVAERDNMMGPISTRHNILKPTPIADSGFSGPSDSGARRYAPEDVSSFETSLQSALDKAQTALKEASTKARREEDAMNTEMNALVLEQRRSSDAVEAKERELRDVQGESSSLLQSSGIGSQGQFGMATASKLERELKEAERARSQAIKELDDFFAKDKSEQTAKEVKLLETEMAQKRTDVELQDEEVKKRSMEQEKQSQISVKSAQIIDDQGRLEEKLELTSAFKSVPDIAPKDATLSALSDALTEISASRDVKEAERADQGAVVMDLNREVAEKNANLRTKVSEKRAVTARLAPLSSAVDVVRSEMENVPKKADGTMPTAEKDFDHILKHWTNQETVQRRKAAVMKSFKQQVEFNLHEADETGKCPSCTRSMNDQEKAIFVHEQHRQLEKTFAEEVIKERDEKREAALSSIANLQKVAQQWREWSRLSSRPAELDTEIEDMEDQAAKKKQELDDAKQELETLRGSREELDTALLEIQKFCDEANRIEGLRDEVARNKSRLQEYGVTGSLSDAQESLRALMTEKDEISNKIQAKGKELTALGNLKYSLTTAKSMRDADFAKAESDLQAKKEFDKKREAFRDSEKVLDGELKDLKAKEQPLRQQVQERTNQHERAKQKARGTANSRHVEAQRCQEDVRAFSRSQREVQALEAKGLSKALASILGKLEEEAETVRENEEAAKGHHDVMTGMVLKSDKQVQHRKVLEDNIDYRKQRRELDRMKEEVVAAEKEIAKVDSQDARGQIGELNREKSRTTEERAELKGRLLGPKDQIHWLETQLASDTYRHIEEKHRRKMIEHRTTEMAVTDLDKYWTALDKALLRFHVMKIADINKIIRELWAMTYCGEDIDMIEIVSGDDEEGGNKAKRAYNYRVVMRKNDATLDMKGRCSAGQRVLASVVIRLALAETFCVSCGILALDEPTTNLDLHNKVGLAHALAKIISSRSKQSNFQLITITHDEEFVQTMRTELGTQGGFSMPEHYWRISREEMSRGKFYSRIDRFDWEDM